MFDREKKLKGGGGAKRGGGEGEKGKKDTHSIARIRPRLSPPAVSC